MSNKLLSKKDQYSDDKDLISRGKDKFDDQENS
jgi:hypothetical protein